MGGLRVLDGARLIDSAASDIPAANYSAGTTNSTALDMEDFNELIGILNAGVVVNTGVTTAYIQECDTSGGTFTNITDATMTINNASNTQAAISVDWKHPDRKRWARLSVVQATAAAFHSASLIAVQSIGGPKDVDSNVTRV